MKVVVANFKNTTGVDCVIDFLELNQYFSNIVEFQVSDFFGDFSLAVEELQHLVSVGGGGHFDSL